MSSRREEILAIAADLFAERGFHGVSVADLGLACGFSGPALYRHFRSKDAILAEMLVSISEELLAVGTERVGEADGPDEALRALCDWHAQFATENQSLIVVQDRDWSSLPTEAREKVRTLQRKYVDLWAREIRRQRDEAHADDPGLQRARAMAHAAFGLINSTPHSGGFLPREQVRELLADMAYRALR